MLTLINKEIRGFLGSLIGYIVIVVFLTTIGLMMWVFPGGANVLDGGYASIDALFFIAPWVFMFLVPAITMRLFAEESRTGTIELLLTKPLTDFQIVFAKYIAGFTLVLFSLLSFGLLNMVLLQCFQQSFRLFLLVDVLRCWVKI